MRCVDQRRLPALLPQAAASASQHHALPPPSPLRPPHAGEDGRLDALSDAVQATVLAAERPDLVVFSGDMVSGWACGRPPRPAPCAPGWFEARWRQLVAPVHAAGLPYAITLGNHE